MPRLVLDLNQATDQQKVGGHWRVATGLVPGEPYEGLTARLLASPARLADYDDSSWEVCTNIRQSLSEGFTFAWYRMGAQLPQSINGTDVTGYRQPTIDCLISQRVRQQLWPGAYSGTPPW